MFDGPLWWGWKSLKENQLSILGVVIWGSRGPFLESPGNFSGPKSNIQIEM